MNQRYNYDLFKKSCELKGVEQSIKSENHGKIRIEGALKDNLIYKSSMESFIGFFLIGIAILFFLLGIAVAYEAMIYPYLTSTLSSLLLLFFGAGIFIVFIVYKSKDPGES